VITTYEIIWKFESSSYIWKSGSSPDDILGLVLAEDSALIKELFREGGVLNEITGAVQTDDSSKTNEVKLYRYEPWGGDDSDPEFNVELKIELSKKNISWKVIPVSSDETENDTIQSDETSDNEQDIYHEYEFNIRVVEPQQYSNNPEFSAEEKTEKIEPIINNFFWSDESASKPELELMHVDDIKDPDNSEEEVEIKVMNISFTVTTQSNIWDHWRFNYDEAENQQPFKNGNLLVKLQAKGGVLEEIGAVIQSKDSDGNIDINIRSSTNGLHGEGTDTDMELKHGKVDRLNINHFE